MELGDLLVTFLQCELLDFFLFLDFLFKKMRRESDLGYVRVWKLLLLLQLRLMILLIWLPDLKIFLWFSLSLLYCSEVL
jgi:hypothetical protein